MKKRQQHNTLNSNFFDILNNALLGLYRETFNAWNQVESKAIIFLKTVFSRFTEPAKHYKQSPLTLQLIPIDPKKEDVFVQIIRPKEYGE